MLRLIRKLFNKKNKTRKTLIPLEVWIWALIITLLGIIVLLPLVYLGFDQISDKETIKTTQELQKSGRD